MRFAVKSTQKKYVLAEISVSRKIIFTGKDKFIQENYESVMAVPYDMPIVGYGNHVVNTLRVWDAKPITDFKLDEFDRGNYHKAVGGKPCKTDR